jgi:hypothetical protein
VVTTREPRCAGRRKHWTQGWWVQTRRRRWIFKSDKNPQHTFFRMRNKARGMLKIRRRISDTDTQNSHSFVHSSYSLSDVSAGRTARELYWTSQEFSPADMIVTMALHAHTSPGGWTIGPYLQQF